MEKNRFEELMEGAKEALAIAEGKAKPARIHFAFAPEEIKTMRQKLKMTQETFAASFCFSTSNVKQWETGKRNPDASARALLRVIAHNPKAVLEALHS
jgi:putative transcriptional regulator